MCAWNHWGQLYLNQDWYFNPQTWPDAGSQQCSINAFNSLGDVAIVYFSLDVAPAGFAASGGGGTYPPGTPGAPVATGSSARSGQPQGFFNPLTGLTYSDAAGTQVCGNCGTDPGRQVNATSTEPVTTETTSTTETTTTSTSSTP